MCEERASDVSEVSEVSKVSKVSKVSNKLGREEGKMYSADERLPADNTASSRVVERQAATETTTVIADSLPATGRDKAAAFQQAGRRALARWGGPEGPGSF
jgi:hypothetical protein